MKLHLSGPGQNTLRANIRITGSKSESNRALLLAARYPNLAVENISNSDDAQVMQAGLGRTTGVVDIHHAGTAMRFLTGYFASTPGAQVTLTGSQRMTERPIKVLVDALLQLGADISYGQEEGYPPLIIKGRKLLKNRVHLPADISSQYISSLLLMAPGLPQGLRLELEGEITSVPYIEMTLGLLAEIGVPSQFKGNAITVHPKAAVPGKTLVVESDWSSASYFYSLVALAEVGSEIVLSSYREKSLQGDRVLAEIYTHFGVQSSFVGHSLVLRKERPHSTDSLNVNLIKAPDIAQTIAVTCFGLGMPCHLTGLHTLKIKETDRLLALDAELKKLGAPISVTRTSLTLSPANGINRGVAIDTYNDHRMAMAFAPLALKTEIVINDAGVVSKSYPDFWKDMQALQIAVKQL
ncbi:3-phosphoshikimate 1-carboxyvinyltransferase [Maribacter sp. 2307ULW6-5]|uniref:3-phosphoshikimate 1-carboxyvinyltransferase n=1 Tax=Maribacter sp. 2307ULW6-5 TaxID=3386275 RepID=UPI0039BD3F51